MPASMLAATQSSLKTRLEEEWLLGLTDSVPAHVFAQEARIILASKAERVTSTGIAAIRNFQASDDGKFKIYLGTWLDHYDVAIPDLDDLVFEIVKRILSGSTEKVAIRAGLKKVGVPDASIKKLFRPPPVPEQVLAAATPSLPTTPQVANVVNTIGENIRSNLFLDSVRDAGIDQWQWKTVNDDRVDDVCEALDGRVFDIDKQFNKAHIGCRCFPTAFYSATKADWAEELHPRNASGQFTSGDTGSGKTEKLVQGALMSKERWGEVGVEWHDQATMAEVQALQGYGGSGYKDINGHLRGRASRGADVHYVERQISRIDSALGDAPPLEQDTKLYRGMTMTQGEINEIEPGHHIDYEAYTSSSIEEDVADQFAKQSADAYGEEPVIVTVHTPQGTKVGPMVMSSSADNESEMLFPRDSKFVITGKDSSRSVNVYGQLVTVHYLHAQYAGDPRINTFLPLPKVTGDIKPPNRSEVLVGATKARKPKLNMKHMDKYVWRHDDVKWSKPNGLDKRKGNRTWKTPKR